MKNKSIVVWALAIILAAGNIFQFYHLHQLRQKEEAEKLDFYQEFMGFFVSGDRLNSPTLLKQVIQRRNLSDHLFNEVIHRIHPSLGQKHILFQYLREKPHLLNDKEQQSLSTLIVESNGTVDRVIRDSDEMSLEEMKQTLKKYASALKVN